MSISNTAPAQLRALPDDTLRVVAAFVPTSDSIALVRCSQRLLSMLRRVLTRHLDGLFVVVPESNFGHYPCTKHLPSIAYQHELKSSLGDAKGWCRYDLAERPCKVTLFRNFHVVQP
jgi:hypothetical protein